MDATARQDFLSQLQQLPDAMLSQLYSYYLQLKQGQTEDWWDTLSPAEQAYLQRGLEQADRGETVSSEEVHSNIDRMLGQE